MVTSLAFSRFALVALVVCSTEPNAIYEGYIAHISNTSQELLNGGLSSGFDPSALLFTGLDKRQQCQVGYGYCSRWSICCPDGSGAGRCQYSASCVAAGQTCCDASAGVRACDVGEKCCRGGCAPDGATCCSGGPYCETPFTQCCEGGGCVP
ncbi:unnamed protein product [Zymoseptoria tritici ST99CH_1E4]|uniref:Granulins domain-containing protein n=1 Tax=Zymoseptoria tritici ST99CH_1E4 TaxID=1276532 RepID=A0A2H1GHL8_ZYMTR|nr:unnamed protein product [Zymoseptoria tritici ST99CH_1E4]